MDAFLTQAKSLAASVDDSGRHKMLDALREIQYSLETPYDTLCRTWGMVGYTSVSPTR